MLTRLLELFPIHTHLPNVRQRNFSTRKEARGATYLWWTSAFISERERNLAIDNTITLAKMGMRHPIIKLRIVAPDSMCGRGFTIFHNEGWKPKFALKENWGRNVFYK